MITLIGLIVIVIIRLTFGHFQIITYSFVHILSLVNKNSLQLEIFGFTILGNSSTRTGAFLGSIGFAELA